MVALEIISKLPVLGRADKLVYAYVDFDLGGKPKRLTRSVGEYFDLSDDSGDFGTTDLETLNIILEGAKFEKAGTTKSFNIAHQYGIE